MSGLAAQEFDAAVVHLRQALALAPDHASLIEAVRALDLALEPGAVNEARGALSVDPRLRDAAIALGRTAAGRLGQLLWREQRYEAAATVLQFAVEGGGPASTWFDLGLTRQDLGDLGGAADAYLKVLEKNPEHVEAAFNLALILQQERKVDAAMKFYGLAYRLRSSTFGPIMTALASTSSGRLWLTSDALVRALGAASASASLGIDSCTPPACSGLRRP